MPWYETPDVRGFWGLHWTGFFGEADPTQIDASGRRDVWSNYYPLIGTYDSADPDVLECHLLQMKIAGVDGVIADWYGLAQAADYPLIHEATEALFAACAEHDMLFSACFEDRSVGFLLDQGLLAPSDVTNHLASTFAWMQTNWFGASHYVRKDGRPLLLNFGPITVTDGPTWDAALATLPVRPYFFALHNLWTQANADGAFTWVHWSAWDGEPAPSVVAQRLTTIHNAPTTDPDRVIPSAVVGFDDVYTPPQQQTFPFLDYRGGQTLAVSLAAALAGDWPIVQLVTWNDYGEGTMFEPTREFGYLFLEELQAQRRAEIGGAFPYNADDLRLPARLLGLRKLGASTATLDAASNAIEVGNVAAARALLDSAASSIVVSTPGDSVVSPDETMQFIIALAPSAASANIQWLRDGMPLVDGPTITGSQTQSLTITNASLATAGVYKAIVSWRDIEVASTTTIGGVRVSGLGRVDINNDGRLDTLDITDFLTVFETAP